MKFAQQEGSSESESNISWFHTLQLGAVSFFPVLILNFN